MSKENWLLSLIFIAGFGCAYPNHDPAADIAVTAKNTDFNYAQLQIKDLNEMQIVVNRQIKKADQFVKDEDDAQAVTALQSALQYVLSRPNSDNMVSQLIPPLRSKLRELDSFEQALSNITDIAIQKIKDKKMRAGARSTSYFVLENYLSEFKPEIAVNELQKNIFVKIRDAKIELDGPMLSDLKMRAMYKMPKSPSEIAAQIIGPAKR